MARLRCVGCGNELSEEQPVVVLTEARVGKTGFVDAERIGALCQGCSSGVLSVPSAVLREIKETAKRSTVVRKKRESV